MRTAVVVIVGLLAATSVASANPRALPFTYTTDTLPPGAVELEQYVDLTPLRAISPATSKPAWYLPSAFQTELEIGLMDRLEIGLYATFVPDFGESLASTATFAGAGTGLKQRLRYAFADPEAWPIDVGVYGEVGESEREVELEAKLLLHKRFDRLRVAVNLSSEYELYYSSQRDLVLNPSAGATYEFSPKIHLGIDSWLRAEYPQHPKPARRTFGLGPQAYVGPAMMFNFGKVWWTLAVYGRVTQVSHDLVPGEPYGPIWVRSLIGYDL
jgi:hypothetical protein